LSPQTYTRALWQCFPGLIITPAVSLATPKINAALVNKIFQCYDNTAKVSSKEYLKEEDL
ncbi:MAG: hypothetical protein K2O40_09705, partial [Lachnospiraceae bacterium]|nr:hypothetical protein [Lachnospiraceae bacterium]